MGCGSSKSPFDENEAVTVGGLGSAALTGQIVHVVGVVACAGSLLMSPFSDERTGVAMKLTAFVIGAASSTRKTLFSATCAVAFKIADGPNEIMV